ncbi:MAG: O-succinylhomoserine sulfhydrylase [Alphaproteobacteria bacterium]|nr:MAG: O-succinylhomoserine sulfhydrylase [Alphaproteobacteria bacterium]TAF13164.1 MAG: O-succinylhomoserine sulfhydrylase [Alphaproteobacteria bacterium]TAF39891.1 MAG: O-succinylhomoserine sulfhydrylase [Alphaproteobacteria bacterium]TAF75787.1 MAG: O-succinylhomoserine sulfhydrylase [Alphaproteobacteria bacterium]
MVKRNADNKTLAQSWHPETVQVRGGTKRSEFGETSEAIFLNSGFCYDNAEIAESRFNGEAPGYVYSRYLNPTLDMLEQRLTLMEEGAEACCVMGSGMAAVFASLMSHLRAGDHIIAHRVLFGSCHYILAEICPRFGMEVSFIDGTQPNAWEEAMRPNTKAVFIETPANPTLDVLDIAHIAGICNAHQVMLIVDNILAGNGAQAPLLLGADVVVYSTTKHMDGQGRTLGGAILGSESFIKETVLPFHRHTGPALSPFNAWVVLKSLETYSLRMARHQSNALAVANALEAHPDVAHVHYPLLPSHPHYDVARKQMNGGGNMIAFSVQGGKKAAFSLMNNLQLIDISNNLGDSKSLITHPATTTHATLTTEAQEAIGIGAGMMRLSVGLEHVDDLIADLINALR